MDYLYPRLIAATMTGLFSLTLGIFALIRNPRHPLNRWFAAFNFAFAAVSMAGYALFIPAHELGLFLYRFLYASGLLVILFLFYFLQELIGVSSVPGVILARRVGAFGVMASFPVVLSGWVIRDFPYAPGQEVPFEAMMGPLSGAYFSIFGLGLVAMTGFVIYHLRRTAGVRRNQLKYVLLGLAFGVGVVVLRIFVLADQMMWVYAGLQMGLTFCLAYAIFKHRLFDFERAMRRGAILAGVYVIVIGIPFLVASAAQRTAADLNRFHVLWPLFAIAYGFLFSLAPAVSHFLQERSEKRRAAFLNRQLEFVKAAAERLADESGLNPGVIGDRMIEAVRGLYWTRLNDPLGFVLFVARPRERDPLLRVFPPSKIRTPVLSDFLSDLKGIPPRALRRPFGLIEIRRWGAADGIPETTRDRVTRYVDENEIDVCFPCLCDDQLVGLLLLGSKKRGTLLAEELSMLEVLCGNAATAIRKSELLDQNRQLTDLDQLKSDLISHITHEFKSPLHVVENAIDVLMADIGKGRVDQGKISDYLLMIRNNAGKLALFIQDLLQVARIEESKVELKRERCDLRDIIRETVSLMEPLATKKGVRVTFDPPKAAARLSVDRDKIGQVCSNLLSNAIKFTDRGGIAIHLNETDDAVRIAFHDDGQGIQSAHLSAVFEKFFQVSNGHGRNLRGSGLGLTIAKAWVEAHGGGIHAESDGIGKGSTFIVTLPRTAKGEIEPSGPATAVSEDDSPQERRECA